MTGYLTTAQAAERLGITPALVRRYAAQGRLAHERVDSPRGVSLFFDPAVIAAFQRAPRGWRKGRPRGTKEL